MRGGIICATELDLNRCSSRAFLLDLIGRLKDEKRVARASQHPTYCLSPDRNHEKSLGAGGARSPPAAHKCLKRAAERRSDMARRGHGALSERLRHGFRLEGRGERHPFPRPRRCILNEHRINKLCFMDMIDMQHASILKDKPCDYIYRISDGEQLSKCDYSLASKRTCRWSTSRLSAA